MKITSAIRINVLCKQREYINCRIPERTYSKPLNLLNNFNHLHISCFLPSIYYFINMKTSLVLSILATLCQSAFSLEEGSYTIGSSLEDNEVLTQTGIGGPVTFDAKRDGESSQTWHFTLSSDSKRDFLIADPAGNFINCGDEAGSPCILGSEQEVYTAELIGDDSYQLVAKKSGYFLRTDGDDLQLAEWDQSPNEVFLFKPAL